MMDWSIVISQQARTSRLRHCPPWRKRCARRSRSCWPEKLETVAEFERFMALGFDYFQGYNFVKPVILSGKKLASSELAIMLQLSLIDSDVDNSEIEQKIDFDV